MDTVKLDLHCHTSFSFDSDAVPKAVCTSAIEKGIKHLALTDHCDYDCILNGVYEEYRADAVKKCIFRLREQFGDKLDIIYGIELGGAHVVPAASQELIEKQNFDFVLGSLHNLNGVPDFYYMNFDEMPMGLIENLVRRSFSELTEIASLPFVHSIAHVTYPLRYIYAAGRKVDIGKFTNEIKTLFDKIIKTDKSLEINTSPYRKGIKDTMPDRELILFYRDCGGKRITVGSDAHTPEGVGDGVLPTIKELQELGFRDITVYNSNGRVDIPISTLIK